MFSGFFMALGRNTQRHHDFRTTKLAAHNSYTSDYLSDQLVYDLGTSRTSEIKGQITDNGKPFEILLNEYIDGL